MEYAIVSLSREKEAELPERVVNDPKLHMLFDGYAPHVWIVSYKGTVQQLTDLLWPNGTSEKEYELPTGLVIKFKGRNINGYAARDLWEMLEDNSDGN